uniref:NADH dehydrogenase subunit 4L n=1 Tax=Colponema vietnamica TaxID=1492817 RepID=V5KVE4_9ALVE|nr:NADH dehydrogenase subunit 4L [Colponema vietnamica]ATY40851.1 NADH dehydrogenase subunit 4L [Colponema vietnamica]
MYKLEVILIIFAILLFFLALAGMIINRNNVIIMLMYLEVMYLSINIQFVGYATLLDDVIGILFPLVILVVSGVDSATGLALFVLQYKMKGSIGIEKLSGLTLKNSGFPVL